MTFRFGSHISFDDYNTFTKMVDWVKKSGGNLVQIFLPMTNFITKREDVNKYNKYLIDNDIDVVVHASYIYNLSRDWDEHSAWIKSFELEIKYAHFIGAKSIVVHCGKKLNLSIQEALNNMYTSMIHVHNKTKQYQDVQILLETSTGQGSEICFKLEDLAHFYKKIKRLENKEIKKRIKLCVDTCHVFSAGYNLKTRNNVKLFIETFEELIGLKYVKLIHLNDCKVECGSQKDRHQNIGEGYIGFDGLKYFFDYFRKLKIPIVLETPNFGFQEEIKLLLF